MLTVVLVAILPDQVFYISCVSYTTMLISLDYSINGHINLELCKSWDKSGQYLLAERPGTLPFKAQITKIKKGHDYCLVDEIAYGGDTILMANKMIKEALGVEINNVLLGVISDDAYSNLSRRFNKINYIYKVNAENRDSIISARNILGLDGKLLSNGKLLPLWIRVEGVLSNYKPYLKELMFYCNGLLKSRGISINWGDEFAYSGVRVGNRRT